MEKFNRIAQNEQQASSSRQWLELDARIVYERLIAVLVFGEAPNEEEEEAGAMEGEKARI